jgi:hypothetical protein
MLTREDIKGNQEKLDMNKNGKLDSDDFKQLRNKKTIEEGDDEEINLDEMMNDMEEEEIDENDINIDELLAEFGLSEEEMELGDEGEEEMPGYSAKMEEELAAALATIDELRSSLQEVNLLNAKLLYMNKVFKGQNLTESQKIQVVKTFDKAESAKEAKLVYESLISTFVKREEKSPIKELGRMILTIPLATLNFTTDLVKQALETISSLDVATWAEQMFGQSTLSKRKKVFSSQAD